MQIRMLDEVVDLGPFGVMLMAYEEDAAGLKEGVLLQDARGGLHRVEQVEKQDDLLMLHIPEGTAEYFERLFRNITVDACLFFVKEEPCR